MNQPANRRNTPSGGQVSAGDVRNGGRLAASVRTNQRGRRVYVNAAELTAVVVDLSVDDAREFARKLLALTEKEHDQG